jgi:hypothetical protein
MSGTLLVLIVLSVVLFLSILVNVFLLWYHRGLTSRLIFFSENTNILLDMIEEFAQHVRSVYELETFYGDQILHSLLQHAQQLVEDLEKFDEIIYLTEEEEADIDDETEEDGAP